MLTRQFNALEIVVWFWTKYDLVYVTYDSLWNGSFGLFLYSHLYKLRLLHWVIIKVFLGLSGRIFFFFNPFFSLLLLVTNSFCIRQILAKLLGLHKCVLKTLRYHVFIVIEDENANLEFIIDHRELMSANFKTETWYWYIIYDNEKNSNLTKTWITKWWTKKLINRTELVDI